MEDDAGPGPVLHGLLEADIQEHGAVEGAVGVRLVDDVDAVVELLLVEHRVKMPQEDGELGLSVPVRHHQRHLVVGGAGGGTPRTTSLKPGQLFGDLGQRKGQEAEAEAAQESRRNYGAGRQGTSCTDRQAVSHTVQDFIARTVVQTWRQIVAVNVCLPGLTQVSGVEGGGADVLVGGAQEDSQTQEQEQTWRPPGERLGWAA